MIKIQAVGDDSYARFEEWRDRIEAGNPNLPLVCLELENYDSRQFSEWIERGFTRIYNEGKYPNLAFSPGEIVLGSNSSVAWQDELLVIISRLSDHASIAAVRGIVDVFQALPPEANLAPDPERRLAQEKKVLELLRIVRSLRAPLCSVREASPLPLLRHLLAVQYPSNARIFREALLTWYAFAYQCDPSAAQQWREIFESSSLFRSEYVPLVAFGLACGTPKQINGATIYWKKFAKYMRFMANEASVSEDMRKTVHIYRDALIKLHQETKLKSNNIEADKELRVLISQPYFEVAECLGTSALSKISKAAECAAAYSVPWGNLFSKGAAESRKSVDAKSVNNFLEFGQHVAV